MIMGSMNPPANPPDSGGGSTNVGSLFGFRDMLVPSIRQSTLTPLRRRDSTFSAATDYKYASPNDLSFWQGATLLTADCLGTGVLALPGNMRVLGWKVGLAFLLLNVPINLYAGTILSNAAGYVERKQRAENEQFKSLSEIPDDGSEPSEQADYTEGTSLAGVTASKSYDAVFEDEDSDNDDLLDPDQPIDHRHALHHDTATFDFIGMTSALFRRPAYATVVVILFYTNIFLVLGDYILVMSHAVSALLGEDWLCIPLAGVLASTLMFAVSQMRTMANLGRSASIISLSALLVVILQCIFSAKYGENLATDDDNNARNRLLQNHEDFSILRKLSATGSIGFAMGSQKLFLNIRHELADRDSAPKSLAVSLSVFAGFYVLVVVLSGPNPPSFLFDLIPDGSGRRIAGFFLWIHVVVSYAINSQAICASMDRIFFYKWAPVKDLDDHHRWMILTGTMAVTAFFISNAIPFFKDLVALIGALTSIPLTLLLPAILHRKVVSLPIWRSAWSGNASYVLLVFSIMFTVAALVGSLNSILADWANHTGGFFACN